MNTTTLPSGTLNPGFSPTTPYNTVVYGPLNPTSNPDSVLTDDNWMCGGKNQAQALSQGNLSSSAGDADRTVSLPLPDGSMYIAPHMNGFNCLLHIHFDPTTGAALNNTNGSENASVMVDGILGFSDVQAPVFYTYNNPKLRQFTIQNDATIVETFNSQFPFDLSTCPGTHVTAGALSKSASMLGITLADRIFTMNLSYVGGQGTASVVVAYQPGVGCAAIDLAPLGTASTYGNVYDFNGKLIGTETACVDPNAVSGQGIHDTAPSHDGRIAMFAGGAWQKFGKGNICFWEIGTTNVQSVSAVTGGLQTSGHPVLSTRVLFFMSPPVPNIRNIYPLNPANLAAFTVIGHILNEPNIENIHGSQAHQFYSDLTPLIIETEGTSPDPYNPLAFVNEVVGLPLEPPGAPALRFGSSYNTPAGSFSCKSGIGNLAPNGMVWFYLSNGLQNFGNDTTGTPRCRLLAKKL